jgi:hypothetical protein
MVGEQYFVGGVAMVLGLLALVAAVHNHQRYYVLPKIRWIEARWGRPAARTFYALLGAILLGLGVVVLLGLHPGG